ncbi:transposable element Tcb2 transposase [Trichonephila clavipes]|nr:transposable element Tcb2 transposase [Trichonephila clavipes]
MGSMMSILAGKVSEFNVVLFSYTSTYGNGSRHFEPCSNDEDDTRVDTSTPYFQTHPMGEHLSLDAFNVHQPPLHGVVLPNSPGKFRGEIVARMGTTNPHRTGCRKPCLVGENRDNSSLWENNDLGGKLVGAVDTRRYLRAEHRVWSDQEDHEETRRILRQALVDPTVTRSTIRADVGVAIVPQTISRHLAEANIKSKRPFRALPLTPKHRQLRLQWCQARSMWNVTDWQKVVFSDDSRFVLGTDDNHVRVWRRPGERYNSPTLLYVTLPAQLV